MNRQMWSNAATQRNVAQLAADGIAILGPDTGELACKENGEGRMLEAQAIYDALVASRQPKVLAGKRVLLTAGPTVEAIDPVRSITNASSGKMGFALARAAAEAGADVTLVAGPTPLVTPAGVTRIDVTSTAQMADAVFARAGDCDIFIAVAAAADYTPAEPRSQKIKKSADELTITLEPTIDILATVAGRPNPPFCVGFAAESQDVVRLAEEKRRRKKLPMIVANRAQDALGSDANEITLLDDAGAHPLPRIEKLALARRLVGEIAGRLTRR
jgi:phosphopantothenoylcysteine decarboxylase/phosphopantothenate--cysteine ligase